jgi:transcriptional regulator with XRE-family HTH domain
MKFNFRQEKVDEFLAMSLSQMADKSGVAIETWSRWFHGKRSPSLDTLITVAPKFDDMNYLELAAGIEGFRFKLKNSTSDLRRGRKWRHQKAS